jgi:hypothetical protein
MTLLKLLSYSTLLLLLLSISVDAKRSKKSCCCCGCHDDYSRGCSDYSDYHDYSDYSDYGCHSRSKHHGCSGHKDYHDYHDYHDCHDYDYTTEETYETTEETYETTDATTYETSDETTDVTTPETSDDTTNATTYETSDETTDATTYETSDATTDETSDATTDETSGGSCPYDACLKDKCYELSEETFNEHDAGAYCMSLGGRLANIYGNEEFLFVNGFLNDNDVDKAWIKSWNGDSYEGDPTKGRPDECIVYHSGTVDTSYHYWKTSTGGGAITADDCSAENVALCEFDRPSQCCKAK